MHDFHNNNKSIIIIEQLDQVHYIQVQNEDELQDYCYLDNFEIAVEFDNEFVLFLTCCLEDLSQVDFGLV